MHISSFLSFRWLCLRLLLAVFIVIVFVPEMSGVGDAHAVRRNAHFDISPAFFPSLHNKAPRANFVYYSNSNTIIQDYLHVKNDGTARGTIKIYAEDAITGGTGGEVFPTDHVLRRDVGGWITMSNQQITLYPGQSLNVPFSLHIPAHVRPGDHAGGIIAGEPDRPISMSQGDFHTNMTIHTREVIGVLIHLPGPHVQMLHATGISYSTENGYQSLQIGLANVGTQILHPTGKLLVTDAGGQLLQMVPLKIGTFLPQTSINYPMYIHHTALKPGTYTATLNMQYEGKHTLHYMASFVVPMPQLPKNSVFAHIASDLVAPDANFFSALTPWHYVVGISFLFFIFSALFFWIQKLYQWKRRRGLIDRDQKTSPAELLEIGSKRSRKGSRAPKD